ncbi:MAG TPA: HNH endonuclease [Tepidisphaeraceae bacterium]|nr:HNH endonuclease [Tepidisphaeraceae bacterium]
MAFSREVAEELLCKSQRRCCLCHKFKGTSIEIHHIDPDLTQGRDDPDNGIPLCFDCHAMVGSYNPKHPRGRKYRPTELKRLRDAWFAAVQKHGLGAADMLGGSRRRTPRVEQHVSGASNVVVGG